MKFLSPQPFVPSGSNFERSKQLFQELGFKINWEAGDYIGFERDGCKFILQKYDNTEFAQNFMLSVGVSNVEEFWKTVNEKNLPKRFVIGIGKQTVNPKAKELNIFNMEGVVCNFIDK